MIKEKIRKSSVARLAFIVSLYALIIANGIYVVAPIFRLCRGMPFFSYVELVAMYAVAFEVFRLKVMKFFISFFLYPIENREKERNTTKKNNEN